MKKIFLILGMIVSSFISVLFLLTFFAVINQKNIFGNIIALSISIIFVIIAIFCFKTYKKKYKTTNSNIDIVELKQEQSKHKEIETRNENVDTQIINKNNAIYINEQDIYSIQDDKTLMNEVEILFSKIKMNSSNEKLRSVNIQEKVFIAFLLKEMKRNKIRKSLQLQRLHDRTINVFLSSREYIGKVNVGNKVNFMQLPRTLDITDSISGIEFEQCIVCIPIWIRYIKKYLL